MINAKALAVWGGGAVLMASVGVVTGWQVMAGAAPAVKTTTTTIQSQTSLPATGNGNGADGGNNGKGGGNGSGTGSPGKALQISAAAPVELAPGETAPLVLNVRNPNSQDLWLTEATARVSSVTPSSCDKRWFTTAAWLTRTRIPAGQTLPFPVQLTFADTDGNQDMCKSATYYFDFSARADQA